MSRKEQDFPGDNPERFIDNLDFRKLFISSWGEVSRNGIDTYSIDPYLYSVERDNSRPVFDVNIGSTMMRAVDLKIDLGHNNYPFIDGIGQLLEVGLMFIGEGAEKRVTDIASFAVFYPNLEPFQELSPGEEREHYVKNWNRYYINKNGLIYSDHDFVKWYRFTDIGEYGYDRADGEDECIFRQPERLSLITTEEKKELAFVLGCIVAGNFKSTELLPAETEPNVVYCCAPNYGSWAIQGSEGTSENARFY
jgi:hypothetical protein